MRAVRRRWWVLVVFVTVGVTIGALSAEGAARTAPTTYRAVHSLLYAGDARNAATGSVPFEQVAVFIRVGEVPVRAQKWLGTTSSPEQLADRIRVTSDQKTGLIEVAATSTDAVEAVGLADTFAQQTISYLTERQDQQRRDRLGALLARVQRLEEQLRSDDAALARDPLNPTLKAQRDANARQYSAAYEEYQRTLAETAAVNLTTLQGAVALPVTTGGFGVPDSPLQRGSLIGIVAFAIGFAVVMMAERLDNRLRDRDRAEAVFNLPVVAEIPPFGRGEDGPELIVGTDRSMRLSETYRTLRTSLVFLAAGSNGPDPDSSDVGVIVVTSPGPGEGKTTAVANLAAAFAETGRRVLVVNADFRRPRIDRFFGPIRGRSMAFDTSERSLPAFERWVQPTRVENVALLDLAGTQGTPGDLARDTARAIASLRSTYDVVLIDTPPLSITAEGLEFVPDATAVLVMARLGRTNVTAAQRTAELLRYGGAHNVALALSEAGTATGRKGYYGYYGYYGDYGKSDRRNSAKRKRTRRNSAKRKRTRRNSAKRKHARRSRRERPEVLTSPTGPGGTPQTRSEWAQLLAERDAQTWTGGSVFARPDDDERSPSDTGPALGPDSRSGRS